MAELLNSNELRVAAYLLGAIACLIAGVRERRFLRTHPLDLWPRFWTLSALVLAAMAFARAADLADVLTTIARSQALESGWYSARRPIQAAVLGVVSLGWITSVALAIWRVPERRRRYLPQAVFVFSLICYAAIRTVSFHYMDAILYNNPILGVRIGSIVELACIGLGIGAAMLRFVAPGRNAVARSMGHASPGAISR